ncbi:hypothetical protein [Nonomuraea basaltis]|uniref:hypothetical protein n=1 Tax=Nonomuraea basaltis TaxID=2495887 RepID=UPI00110C5BC0|nr:hypothetical protein [Nonomuraea basaltis]TMR88994.1 hypothetical protein EJK15_63140 [Nonomuraea basaltis]
MTVQDLRDVLRERAEAPSPANPHRHDQVHARIRRTRLHRRLTAGAAVVAAVVVGVSLLPGTTERPRETTAAARPAPELPERFTAADGTEYRRVATATLKAKAAQKTSVTIPVTGKPLDVAALCDGVSGGEPPNVSVNGRDDPESSFTPCEKEMQLRELTVPDDAEEVTVTFDTTTYGSGCVSKTKGGPCVPIEPRPVGWSLAVYEWTPPARPVEAEPVRAFPGRLGGGKLAAFTSGMWPQDSSFTMTFKSTGTVLIDQLCTGDLAGRMRFTFQVDGSPGSGNCGIWKEGPFPMAMSEFWIPKGKQVTVRGKLRLRGESANRPVRWSVGAYVK